MRVPVAFSPPQNGCLPAICNSINSRSWSFFTTFTISKSESANPVKAFSCWFVFHKHLSLPEQIYLPSLPDAGCHPVSNEATLRRVIPKILKNSSQKVLASASSLISFSHSLENTVARRFISFQLSGMVVINFNISKSKIIFRIWHHHIGESLSGIYNSTTPGPSEEIPD